MALAVSRPPADGRGGRCCRRAQPDRGCDLLRGARHHLGGALRHRDCAPRRVAGSRRLAAAQREEARYHLLARNMTDVITRHGRNGAVTVRFAGRRVAVRRRGRATLLGHGLFDRVHVADRPGLSDGAGRRGDPRRKPHRSSSACAATAEPAAHAGVQFVWVEMRCRPLECSDRGRPRPTARRRRGHARRHRAQGAGAGGRGRAQPRPSAPTTPRAVSSPP